MKRIGDFRPNIIPAERKKRIFSYILQNGCAQIRELSNVFLVSEATVRRDLAELETEGYIERTHGGAVLSGTRLTAERGFTSFQFDIPHLEEKKSIAEHMASYIPNGDRVFLDVGTTAFEIAKRLHTHRDLTVVTCDLVIASMVEFHPSSTLIVTGGIKREGGHHLLMGTLAVEFLKNIHLDKAILSVDAIDPDYGLSHSDYTDAVIKRLVTQIADQVYVAADHSKFGRPTLARVCGLDKVDRLVTDDGLSPIYHRRLRQKGVPFFLASSQQDNHSQARR